MTVAAWPGTDFRLWAVSLAKSIWRQGLQMPPISAAVGDACGHLIARTQLGTMGESTFCRYGCLMGMTGVGRPSAPETGAVPVSAVFQARYPELVRLADLLGADDPEDIAQEAFARLIRRQRALRDPDAALGYVRSTVCNLVRNRRRHLRVARLRTPAGHDEASSEHAVMLREDRREVRVSGLRRDVRRTQ